MRFIKKSEKRNFMNELKIFTATHKEYELVKNETYTPIHVGASKSDSTILRALRDDIGQNISHKNSSYCELTAMYWIWKNYNDYRYVGLCHYRRFFDFRGSLPSKLQLRIRNITTSQVKAVCDEKISYKIKNILEEYDIIVPKPPIHRLHGIPMSYERYYKKQHNLADFNVLTEVIKEKYPNYEKCMIDTFKKIGRIYQYNMLITSKELWNQYCTWLFDILFEVENRITISDDPYQSRVFGFLAERMLKLFVNYNSLKVYHAPLAFVNR